MKDDVTLISLDTKSTFEEGELVAFAWSGCSFDAAGFQNVSPQKYRTKLRGSREFGENVTTKPSGCRLSKEVIVSMRHGIQRIFHPPRKSSRSTTTQHNCNNSYDHAGYMTRNPRKKKTFFILPNMKKCFDDFAILGFCPSNQ